MTGNLSDSEIDAVLAGNLVGRIGCHADGRTYVVPLSYAYDGQFIYVRTQEGLKIDMLRKNPELCFQVDTLENMANWKSVVIWGRFEELTDPELRSAALQKLFDRTTTAVTGKNVRFYEEWPFTPSDPDSLPGIVFRIHLKEKTGRFEDTVGSPTPRIPG